VYRDHIRSRVNEILNIFFGILDHKMRVEKQIRRFPALLYYERPESDVGNEMSVHYIKMKPVRSGIGYAFEFVLQISEIG